MVLVPETSLYLHCQPGVEYPVYLLLSDLLPPACQVQVRIFLRSSVKTKIMNLFIQTLCHCLAPESLSKWHTYPPLGFLFSMYFKIH